MQKDWPLTPTQTSSEAYAMHNNIEFPHCSSASTNPKDSLKQHNQAYETKRAKCPS
jgi:hypothetical protein